MNRLEQFPNSLKAINIFVPYYLQNKFEYRST